LICAVSVGRVPDIVIGSSTTLLSLHFAAANTGHITRLSAKHAAAPQRPPDELNFLVAACTARVCTEPKARVKALRR
jgi:hypothetical protein